MMTDITFLNLYSPEEINAFLKLFTEFLMLSFGTSVGVFIREFIFPKENTFGQNIGFTLLSGAGALWVVEKFGDTLGLPQVFLICIVIGFLIPSLKEYLKGTKIIRAIIKAFRKTQDFTANLAEEVDEQLDKEENSADKK